MKKNKRSKPVEDNAWREKENKILKDAIDVAREQNKDTDSCRQEETACEEQPKEEVTRRRKAHSSFRVDDVELYYESCEGRLTNYTMRFQGGSKIEFWVEE